MESTLVQLMQRDDGPFVTRLPREPGKRESRFAHLFGDEVEIHETAVPGDGLSTGTGMAGDRMEQLEQMVNQLRDELAALKARLDRISPEQDSGSMQ